MPGVSAVTAVWNGFTGAPGYSKLYFQELTDAASRQGAVDAVRAFFLAFTNFLKGPGAGGWTIQVSQVVQTFDLTTGSLLREETAALLPPVVNGTVPTTTTFAGGVGVVCQWVTGVVVDGRKVLGKTFLVPFINAGEADGTITTTARNAVTTAGNALATSASARLVVYHRKFDKPAGEPDRTQIGGTAVPVIASQCPDRVAVMRSRRQ